MGPTVYTFPTVLHICYLVSLLFSQFPQCQWDSLSEMSLMSQISSSLLGVNRNLPMALSPHTPSPAHSLMNRYIKMNSPTCTCRYVYKLLRFSLLDCTCAHLYMGFHFKSFPKCLPLYFLISWINLHTFLTVN